MWSYTAEVTMPNDVVISCTIDIPDDVQGEWPDYREAGELAYMGIGGVVKQVERSIEHAAKRALEDRLDGQAPF